MLSMFPEKFLFGTSTAAHQVEGDNKWNDWWYYEEMGKLPYKSGKACNHWELYREDIELMAELGYNAYRFSIEWSRLFPEEGKFNEDAFNRYREIIELLLEKGITPNVTLHHFTSPLWFMRKGGFLKEENLKYWEGYVDKAAELLKGVKLVATFNEPLVYVTMGYLTAYWPPFIKSPFKSFRVAANLLKAHAIAYELLHGKFQVGIVKHIRVMLPERKGDEKAAQKADNLFNWYFLDAIWSGKYRGAFKTYSVPESDADFIGVNYYTASTVRRSLNPLKMFFEAKDAEIGERRTQMGWSVYPEGVYLALRRASEYGRPLYVTENGIATLDDEWRKEFIIQHLRQVLRAIEDGLDVRGYFYWSLMDNYEWREGFEPRFGLIEVDFETFERRPRGSAYLYGEIARTKKLPGEEDP
ncbi:membrane-bound beta-glycosidase, GH1 family [Thermococcus kodakarensis KOD1]|uniref:Membrane-bound beta-glycosidase, GH1 family n=2 Tax=Thermococcus TaxID=2263 RepID=Q5JDV2_THEKO|nr:glycoside hydrolase family 1 protein [Thermococcus kodakarensis]AKS12199.1 beta-glycosidase [synthetic construct]WCN27735.1 glycoside hydrolase family 1 protein [Thermococcus kodakarensis]WCN30028.1 glycoside hydrolase family 1 protein [Thermococcus kodakarensis]BAD86016.1 membrane-bound beta-glycosidase, GH1 family [Thermococcus kodakarensis KOD1]